MPIPNKIFYTTVEEYLIGEKTAAVKHEYVDGEIYELAGSSARHYRLTRNIGRKLENHLADSDCEVFLTDMKTKVSDIVYYYPDVVITCEKIEDLQDIVSQPILIIEVLSPSTASKDRREKLIAYKLIDSLQEYAIVWQDEQRMELHRRRNETDWLTFFFTNPDDEVEFASVAYRTSLSEIYQRINFPQ